MLTSRSDAYTFVSPDLVLFVVTMATMTDRQTDKTNCSTPCTCVLGKYSLLFWPAWALTRDIIKVFIHLYGSCYMQHTCTPGNSVHGHLHVLGSGHLPRTLHITCTIGKYYPLWPQVIAHTINSSITKFLRCIIILCNYLWALHLPSQ